MWRAIAFLLAFTVSAAPWARGVYQEPSAFIAQAFAGTPPQPAALWYSGAVRTQAERILGHPVAALRERYWARDGRSAWVLEEIGKERPITVGIVVEQGRIAELKVLVFRESRGWEVRYPAFTRQFDQARLTGEQRLDRTIDGISGATLSVRALKKLARLALFLDQQVHGADS